MKLKEYQNKAVLELKSRISDALKRDGNYMCVFQAPTGSGKTVTCAHLLKTLTQEHLSEKPLSFIWLSVGKLHVQSKDKLEQIYEYTQALQCSYFDDLENNILKENEIWFINWEKINQVDKNIIVKESECEKYLDKIIQNTKDAGHNIILIIDESHHTAQSARSKELISMISPNVTLEVSATPILKDQCSFIHKTEIEEVRAEEMIKNEVLINPKIDKHAINHKSATELVIKQSIEKQKELRKMYRDEGSDVNPLILVQLPPVQGGVLDKKEEILDEYKKYGKTVNNGKLAIWLSDEHSPNLANIEKNDNDVDVLLFKQAIAIGWDCPRAAILVIFREVKRLVFTIQVIGRIMRMPEHMHYTKNPDLNLGYILTNLERLDLAQEYVQDYARQYHLERDDSLYTPIKLHSVYLKRQRERTRLSGKFLQLFAASATDLSLKENLNMTVKTIRVKTMVDGKMQNVDEEISEEISVLGKRTISLDMSDTEIQRHFDSFIVESCKPFAPYDSGDRMKTALYDWLYKNFGVEKLSTVAQVIILSQENRDLFSDVIQAAKERYKHDVIENIQNSRERIENAQWEIPKAQATSNGMEQNYKKHVMKPAYINPASNPERKFMEKLESEELADKIEWWYKNGEREIKYFAVPYIDEFGLEWAFYVDFIIKFSDGTVGLFDTKSGKTAEDAKYRAKGLARYIQKHSTDKNPLVGGIVILADKVWRYNDNMEYEYDPDNLADWKFFSQLTSINTQL